METKRNNGIMIGIIAMMVAIIGTGVAFAALSQTLTINGSAKVDPAKWDVHFSTLSAVEKTGGAEIVTAPVLSATSIGTFDVKLTKPGDSIAYTFYVENTGTLDAKIGTFTKAAKPTCVGTGANAADDADLVCDNLTYTLTYITGGTAVGANDTLLKGAENKKQMQLKLTYDASATELPAETVTISDLGITMVYVES